MLGTPGSGTTTAAATIAHAFAARHGRRSVEVLPDAGSAAWDLLERWSTSTPTMPRLLVVDRLDQVFRSWPDEYRIAGEAMLESVLRRMRGGECGVVATAGRLAAIPAALRDGFGVVLPLRQASRADLAQLVTLHRRIETLAARTAAAVSASAQPNGQPAVGAGSAAGAATNGTANGTASHAAKPATPGLELRA